MCFEYISDFFYKHKYNITPPKTMIKTDYNEFYTYMHSEFPDVLQYYSWDYKYHLTTFEEYQRFIRWSRIDKNLYIPEYFDCDNFAFALYGEFKYYPQWSSLAQGVLLLNKPNHALNFFVTDKYEVFIVEPQTDNIFKIPNNYEISFIII